jgi:murein DD-endopeptidase MepM/ murein hydrolase activator NlpD
VKILVVLVLLVAASAVALWQFDIVEIPFLRSSQARVTEASNRSFFEAVKTADVALVSEALNNGANVNARDQYGQTPLMYAASESESPAVLKTLLQAGAEINAQTDAGWTALMYAARDAQNLEVPVLLMNAGADPALRNAEGQSVLEVAGPRVRSSTLYRRLEELVSRPFDPQWPSGYVVPVEGATISSRAVHLPNAPRRYRNGIHEGFDFYQGTVSVPITYGTPIQSVANGVVVRADHGYVEMTREEYDQVIETSRNSLITPEDMLDKLRGRQVWIEHPGGFITRYAHLAAIPESVQVGQQVAQGDVIGTTGNSGTIEAVLGTQDDPHPHVEIWRGDAFLGQGLEPNAIYDLAAQVFGQRALPPFRDTEW